jgi:hypothetical protein
LKKIKECPKQPHDPAVTKLCEECGWAGPRESWPELPSSTDSSDEDSDLSDEDEKDKKEEESEETKAKRLAANTPKVQVQLEGQEPQPSSSSSSDNNNGDTTTSPKWSCNGSCQTSKHNDSVEEEEEDSETPTLAKVVDEIEHVQL